MVTRQAVFQELDGGVGRVSTVVSLPKTGSTTVAAALVRAGVPSLIRTHTLRPARLEAREERYRGDPRHLRLIWEAQWLAGNPPTTRRPWSVVSAVRDPIARMVSAAFQAYGAPGASPMPASNDGVLSQLSEQVDRVMSRPNPWAVDFFDINFKEGLGVDVYAHPFDPSVGWGRITTDCVDLLLVRTEGLDVATEALSSMFGVDLRGPLRAENVGQSKGYAERYRDVVRRFRPSAEYVDKVYGDRLAQHFYSPSELDGFRARWTA